MVGSALHRGASSLSCAIMPLRPLAATRRLRARIMARWSSRNTNTGSASLYPEVELDRHNSLDLVEKLVEGGLDARLRLDGVRNHRQSTVGGRKKRFLWATKINQGQRHKNIDWENLRLLLSVSGVAAMLALIMLLCNTDMCAAISIYKDFQDYLLRTRVALTSSSSTGSSAIRTCKTDQPSVSPSGMLIFSGSGNSELAQKVCSHLGISLGQVKLKRWQDGEINLEILDDVRSRDVYVFQSVVSGGVELHNHIMELFLTISALRRASAERITAVLPYAAYSRLEDTTNAAQPLAVADMSRLLYTIGVDRVVYVDHHVSRAGGMFPEPLPVTDVSPHKLAIDYLLTKKLKGPVIVATENTGGERAKEFWSTYKIQDPNAGLATLVKSKPSLRRWPGLINNAGNDRSGESSNERPHFVGDVRNRDCIIVDDLVDTGTRITDTVKQCKAKGAGRVFVFVTHGLLTKGALGRLDKCDAEEILMTDTVELPRRGLGPKIHVLSVSSLIADILRKLHEETNAIYRDNFHLSSLYGNPEREDNVDRSLHEQ